MNEFTQESKSFVITFDEARFIFLNAEFVKSIKCKREDGKVKNIHNIQEAKKFFKSE